MRLTYNELIRSTTEEYLKGIDPSGSPEPAVIEGELLEATDKAIEEYNMGPRDPNAPDGAPLKDAYPEQKKPDERIRKLKELVPRQLALILKHVHHAKLISWSEDGDDGNYDIGVYRYDGDSAGIYDTRGDNLERLIRRYDATISRRNVEEVVAIMRAECPVVSPCSDADLVAVNNGVYDYRNKLLLEFDPEFVFISKIETNYVEGAPNPVYRNEDGTTWDVVSWMDSLSDDPEVVDLLWRLLGAVVRPNVAWIRAHGCTQPWATTARERSAPSRETFAARERGRPSPSRPLPTNSSSRRSPAYPQSSRTRTTRELIWTMPPRSNPSSRATRF